MKKLIVALLIVLVMFPVFSYQETYRYSSEEVQTLLTLKKMSGSSMPDMTYPVTGDQMLWMLDKIDTSKLSEKALNAYENLRNNLENKNFLIGSDNAGIECDLSFGFNAWYGDNISSLKDRLPAADIDATVYITPNFTGKINVDLRVDDNKETSMGSLKASGIFNIMGLSMSYPSQAYGSLGNKYINLIIGRDRVSAGNGITGNLQLGENFSFNEFGKFSVFAGHVGYDFTAIVFDGYDDDGNVIQYNYNNDLKVSVNHRFSFNLKKVSLSIFEGAMVYGSNVLSDIRTYNPFMVIHNTGTYGSGYANNYFGCEVNVALPNNLNLDAQLLVDQFKLPWESSGSQDGQYGFLVNISGSWYVGEGILDLYTEGVLTTKGLYLKENPNYYNSDVMYYMTDLYATNYIYNGTNESAYLGYNAGPEAFVASAGGSYEISSYKFSADAYFKIKGNHGYGSDETPFIITGDKTKSDKNYQLSLLLGAEGKIAKGVYLYTKFGTVNFLNGKSSDVFQAFIGAKINVSELVF